MAGQDAATTPTVGLVAWPRRLRGFPAGPGTTFSSVDKLRVDADLQSAVEAGVLKRHARCPRPLDRSGGFLGEGIERRQLIGVTVGIGIDEGSDGPD